MQSRHILSDARCPIRKLELLISQLEGFRVTYNLHGAAFCSLSGSPGMIRLF